MAKRVIREGHMDTNNNKFMRRKRKIRWGESGMFLGLVRPSKRARGKGRC